MLNIIKIFWIIPNFFLVIDSSLINHWSFNEQLNRDETGNAHLFDGKNAYLTEDRFGKPNSALYLEDGYIKIPPGVYFKGEFTITAWVKLRERRHFARILEFGNGPYSDNIELSFKETTSYVHLKTWFQTDTKGFLDSSSPLNLDEWTHVAASLCGGLACLYYNGILVASGTQYSPRSIVRSNNFIGKGSFEGDQNANALFDDIKIYDECLNDFKIKDEVNKQGLIHYWSFNGNLTKDEIGKANLLNDLNTALTKDRFEKPNSALGLKNGHIKMPTGVYFNCDFTITLWIKLISIESYIKILNFGNGKDNDNINIFLNDGILSLDISSQLNTPTFTLASSSINKNEWTHVAVVLNGNNSRIYYNSFLVAFSFTVVDAPRNVIRSSNFIGDNLNAEAYYDEIKIFDRALNQYEIEKEADINKKGPIHYWSFNGDLTRDEIGDAHLINPVNVNLHSDRFENVNSAIRLRNGFLTMPPRIYFTNNDFTITVWVKLNYMGYYSRILDVGQGQNSENIILSTYTIDSSYIGFWIINGKNHSSLKSSTALKLNKWTHIAAVLNGTKGQIYLNGILDTTGDLLMPKNITRNSSFIGKSNWGHDRKADAVYDEIKIFDRALNSFEIADDARLNNIIFNLTQKQPKVKSGDLVNYWSFNGHTRDEINDSELYDSLNANLVQDRFGISNSALQLENGYFKVPYGFYFKDDFTFTIWIKLDSYRKNAVIIDFGNNIDDNILISTDDDSLNSIVIYIYDESSKTELKSKLSLNLNEWTHLAIVFNKGKADIYFNCTHDISGPLYIPRNLLRMNNYIGKSNFKNYKNAHGCYDEIKIYKRALSLSELIQDMNQIKNTNQLSSRSIYVLNLIFCTNVILIIIIFSKI